MTEVSEHSVIDSRYRVVRHLGSGGMADVYCAEDTHLGRTVAVKLLHRRFAQDAQFVERFRREASAAAALQHPNVVSVYDRGEFDGTYYIAMEFCPGSTLKELINREAPLEPHRAIEIAKRILVAARFAHRRGVIHRDLKPHNVIVDPEEGDDLVKVTDFGIARAGASEITEVGAIMGTAHYLSPEQAQGRPVTAASDLYSVGVVLYEMLTGHPPFDGDSAVAIALKHVSQPPRSLREVRPELPPELDAVVMRSLAKEPAARYNEADSFIRDLDAAEAALDHGAPPEGERTAAFIPPPVLALPPTAPVAVETAPAQVSAEAPPRPPGGESPAEPRRRSPRPWIWLIVALALGAVVFGAYQLFHQDQVRVPGVLGQRVNNAREVLEGAGFEVDIKRRTDVAPIDTVIDQVPARGQETDKGSTVTLLVSNGPSTVKVPDVLGLPLAQARDRIRRDGLRPRVEKESSAKVVAGNVIRSDPGPGLSIERGSRVTLVVSSGAQQVSIPSVVGQSQDDAVTRLEAAGLNVIVRERESSETVNTVVEQTPPGGETVDEGSSVTLFVSNGKLKEVPDVVGESQGAAESDLGDAGFDVSVRTKNVDNPDQDGKVLSQTPSGGKKHRKGGTIAITVGSFTAPSPTPPPGNGVTP